MKFLVLGSSGQIGSHLVDFINRNGHQTIEFDILHSQEEDLRIYNSTLLLQKMYESDFVLFLAFDIGGSRYLKSYERTLDFISNNSRIMSTTFTALSITKRPFIFASSQMSNMSYSPYGQLKALGEFYTQSLNGLIVKFWNVYGLEKDPEKAHVITDFIKKAKKNKHIEMMTDGSELRQFLYADDCSECLLKLAQEYPHISRSQELHITNFEWHSILDVAQIIAKLYPGTTIKPANSLDSVQKDKRNEPNRSILSLWQPRTTLSEGIRKTGLLMDASL